MGIPKSAFADVGAVGNCWKSGVLDGTTVVCVRICNSICASTQMCMQRYRVHYAFMWARGRRVQGQWLWNVELWALGTAGTVDGMDLKNKGAALSD